MKEGVDVIYVSCWLKDAEDYVDVIFVFFVPHGFLCILHKFFARFLRRERRTKKKCVHSMIMECTHFFRMAAGAGHMRNMW